MATPVIMLNATAYFIFMIVTPTVLADCSARQTTTGNEATSGQNKRSPAVQVIAGEGHLDPKRRGLHIRVHSIRANSAARRARSCRSRCTPCAARMPGTGTGKVYGDKGATVLPLIVGCGRAASPQ